MALNYKKQHSFPVIGTVVHTYLGDNVTIATAVRTPWTLAATYPVAENPALPTLPIKSFRTAGQVKLNLDILYTEGATETANSIEIKIESSPDGVNFYRIPNEAVSAGTSTITAREFTFVGNDAASATIAIGIDIFYKYMRISAKESGVVTNFGTAFVQATLSGL